METRPLSVYKACFVLTSPLKPFTHINSITMYNFPFSGMNQPQLPPYPGPYAAQAGSDPFMAMYWHYQWLLESAYRQQWQANQHQHEDRYCHRDGQAPSNTGPIRNQHNRFRKAETPYSHHYPHVPLASGMIDDHSSHYRRTGEVGKITYSTERTGDRSHRSRWNPTHCPRGPRRKKRVDLSEYEVPLVLQSAMPVAGGSNIPPSSTPSPSPAAAQPTSAQEPVEDDNDDSESTISLGSD